MIRLMFPEARPDFDLLHPHERAWCHLSTFHCQIGLCMQSSSKAMGSSFLQGMIGHTNGRRFFLRRSWEIFPLYPFQGGIRPFPLGTQAFFFFFLSVYSWKSVLKNQQRIMTLYKSQWLTWAFWSSFSLISFDYILINFFWLPRHLALGTPCSTRYIHRYLWVRGPWLPS